MRFSCVRIGMSVLVVAGLLFCGAQMVWASFTYSSTFISGLNTPQGIWMGSTGDIYIAQAGTTANSKILHYSATGALITSWTLNGARPRTVVVNPDNGYVYTVGSGNLLEFADFDHSAVYTTRLTGLGTYSTFNPTQGMAFNADRTQLYVTTSSAVKIYSTSDWSLVQSLTLPFGSKITGPGALALDSHGNIFVVDYRSTIVAPVGNARVVKYDATSQGWSNYLSSYVDTLNANTSDTPSGVFVDNADNLYVLVRGTRAGGDGAIYKYNASGSLLSSTRTINSGILNSPLVGLWVDANRYVYAASTSGGQIKKYIQTADPPTNVSAVDSAFSISLSWTNSTLPDFDSVTIRRSTVGYPATVTDGTAVDFDSCDFADILPEIHDGFFEYTLGDFRTAVADLRLDNRHEIDERVLCDLRVTKVNEVDVATLRKYLNGDGSATQPMLASLIPQDKE